MSKFPIPSAFCKKHNSDVFDEDLINYAYNFSSMECMWRDCHRVNWLLWMYQNAGVALDPRALRLFACWCIEETPGVLALKDQRSRDAVHVAKLYANGEVNWKTLLVARVAANKACWEVYPYQSIDRQLAQSAEATTFDAAIIAAYEAARYAIVQDSYMKCGEAHQDRDVSIALAQHAQADALRRFIPNPFKE